MGNTVRIQKTIVSKEELNKVIDNRFNTFITNIEPTNNDTLDELFRLYNLLYYEIPLEGDNSHTYLIQESSKLITLDSELLQIQPLLDEITQLRERLLQANLQIVELQTQASINAGN